MSSKMGNTKANQATDAHTCVSVSFSHTYTAKSHLVPSLNDLLYLEERKTP